MFRVDFPQILVNSAAIIGIWFLYFNISNKVAEKTIDLLREPFIDNDAEEEEEKIRKREIARRMLEGMEEVRRIEEEAVGKPY